MTKTRGTQSKPNRRAVVAASAAIAAALLVTAPVAEAVVKKTCCYRVISISVGKERADFGNHPEASINGIENYRWSYSNRLIVEYVEGDGEPRLQRPVSRSGRVAPGVTEGYYKETNDLTRLGPGGSRVGKSCNYERSSSRVFVDGTPVGLGRANDASPETQKLFPRSPVLLYVLSNELDVGPECDGSVHGPPIPESEEDPVTHSTSAGQAYWGQHVVAPPRRFLRHGKILLRGKTYKRIATNHTLPLDQAANAHDGGRHAMSGSIAVKVTISWFPRSKLANEVARLRAYAASDDD